MNKQQHRRQSSSTIDSGRQLRGIHININSDPFQHRIPSYVHRWWQQSRWKQTWRSVRLVVRRRKLEPLLVVVLLGTCFVLLIHVGFFSGKRYQDWQQDHQQHNDDHIDLLDQVYPDAGKRLTTLVTVLPPYDDAELLELLQPSIQLACQYDLFGHWLIWTHHTTNITIDTLLPPSAGDDPAPSQPPSTGIAQCSLSAHRITIHRASSDVKATARYFACNLAPTPYCYFQDLDTPVARHVRSVYANFLRSPSYVHGETLNPAHYRATQWSWCFYNDRVDLHACYAPPEAGLFVAKSKVEHFLHQLELNPVEPAHADFYFTLWMNEGPPRLLQGDIDTNYSTVIDIDPLHKGLISLYNSLNDPDDDSTATAPLDDNVDTRAACHNDRCVFLANRQMTPPLDLFVFSPDIMTANDNVQLRNDYYFNGYPGGQYTFAVDQHDDTAWISATYARKDDYIGLDLLMPLRIPLKYRILVDHPYSYTRSVQPQISFDGVQWIDLRVDLVCNPLNALLECHLASTMTGYRFIRLLNRYDLDYRFKVHDFSLNAKTRRSKNGQLLDIGDD
ncbi:hypothetical protein BC940DRAFT_305539 [Gongronella butleri]|nr:hypothetical protein BC940DRAFT_305539 [Gongronella butleri]